MSGNEEAPGTVDAVRGAENLLGGGSAATVPHSPDGGAELTPGDVAAAWAENQVTILAPEGGAPEYGGPGWVALRAEDPRKAAAVIEAAELWRRQQARERDLDALAESDPEAWWIEATEDAETEARRVLRRFRVSSTPTGAEMAARRSEYGPVHQLKATPGWPPIAVPGQPGLFLHPPTENAA